MVDKPFDPDEYLARNQAPVQKPFDPGEYLDGKSKEAPTPSTAADLARVAGTAVTFGLWPRVRGLGDVVFGDKTYSEAAGEQFALDEAAKKRLGALATGGAEAVGGLASGMGLARSGATLLGRMAQAPWWQRAIAGAGEAGAMGAAHGMGNTFSDKPQAYFDSALQGLGTGAAIGAGLPLLGNAASALYRRGADYVAGIPPKLGSAARADAAGLANMQNLGPEAMLIDTGPAMQSVGQAYVQGSGPYRSRIVNALAARDEGTVPRLAADRQAALGTAPRVSQIEAELNADRQAVNTLYEPHLQGAVIDQAGAGQTLQALSALSRNRDVNLAPLLDRLQVEGLELSPRQWLNVRHRADDMASSAAAAGNRNEASVYGEARRLIDQQIGQAAPGVKMVDARFADIANQGTSFQTGRNVLDTGKDAIHPQDVADAISGGSTGTNLRLRQGAHADLERRMGTSDRDLSKIETIIGAPWNREKYDLIFGQQPTEQVAKSVAANRQFRETYDRLARGSDTAQRQAALAEHELRPLPKGSTSLYGRGEQIAAWLIDKARTANQEAVRDEIARRIVLQGQAALAERDRLMLHNAGVVPRSNLVDKYTRAGAQGALGELFNPGGR